MVNCISWTGQQKRNIAVIKTKGNITLAVSKSPEDSCVEEKEKERERERERERKYVGIVESTKGFQDTGNSEIQSGEKRFCALTVSLWQTIKY